MKPYTDDVTCDKCGEIDSSMARNFRYEYVPERTERIETPRYEMKTILDHLQITCSICGYTWKMRPADTQED